MSEYQHAAMEAAVYPMKGRGNLAYATLGLSGEVGEFANVYKKWLRGDHQDSEYHNVRAKLINELGDVLWYVSACASELGVSLDYVAECNLLKLQARKKAGTIKGDGEGDRNNVA